MKDDKYGTFNASKTGLLYSVKLEGKSEPPYWGTRIAIRIMITNRINEQILPSNIKLSTSNLHYKVPGFNANSPFLSLHTILNPIKVNRGDELRIWYIGDRYNVGEGNRKFVADVYAIII